MRTLALLLLLCPAVASAAAPPAALPVPAAWPTGAAYPAAQQGAGGARWRDLMRDGRLVRLIETALDQNRDLRAAVAAITAARARVRIARSDQIPQIEAQASASRRDTATATTDSLSAAIGMTGFEIDLFGRLSALSRAEQARLLASEHGARAVRIALIADIATAWIDHGANASLLAIARDTARSAERSVALTRARLHGGVAPRSDLAQAEQVLAQAHADMARAQTALARDANLLRLLVGTDVAAEWLPVSVDEAMNAIALPAAGMDSTLLLARPDVAQAEAELRAARANVDAARAALFPRITLTGALGFASDALSGLFAQGAFVKSGQAGAGYSLFGAGAGKGAARLAKAQATAALARYEAAIQSAFRDVADALARAGTIGPQMAATSAQQNAAADTASLAQARYQGGVASYIEALDAQRSLYSARRAHAQSQQESAVNRVELYRALGSDDSL